MAGLLADGVIAGLLVTQKDKTPAQKRIVTLAAILVAVVGVLLPLYITYGTRFTRTIHVNRTYTGTRDGNTHYFVEADDDDVYEVESALLLGFFTPAELWNRIQPGRTYRVDGFGFRVGLLRWYPTIVAIA